MLLSLSTKGYICGIIKKYVYIQEKTDDIQQDFMYFPIPHSLNPDITFTYEDSWMSSRNYGGNRVHEGCDIMMSLNQRGLYPVVSVSNGVVEKVGWLKLGGYRIGIRSEHGIYFYYAHLADYAKSFQCGDVIYAGELLGYAGDSGYSETEGTVGNFPVHLHFGMYQTDADGTEISMNPYPYLKKNEGKYLTYQYGNCSEPSRFIKKER